MADEITNETVDDPAATTADDGVLPPDNTDHDFVTGGEPPPSPAAEPTTPATPAATSATPDSSSAPVVAATPDAATDWRATLGQEFGVDLTNYDRPEAAARAAMFAVQQAARDRQQFQQQLQQAQQ